MRPSIAAALAAGLLLAAPAVAADVKTGVDAWQQGDYARAVEQWRPLAIGGNADAQFNLGQAHKLGRGVPADLQVALEWFRKASEQGHEKASDNYGLLLFQQGRREDAMPFIRASAERGEPRAQYVYATALFNGDLVPRDWARAYALMTRAARQGVAQARTSLAQMEPYIEDAQRSEALAIAALPAGSGTAPAPTQALGLAPAPAPVTALPSSPIAGPMAQTGASPSVRTGTRAPAKPAGQAPASRPASTQAATAPPRPAGNGRYQLQLGAFREGGRAPALWKSVSAKVSGLSAFRPSYVLTNGLTRLLVGPVGTSDDGERLCARIKATGTPCLVQGS